MATDHKIIKLGDTHERFKGKPKLPFVVHHDGKSLAPTVADGQSIPGQVHRLNQIVFNPKEGLIQKQINGATERSEMKRSLSLLWWVTSFTLLCCIGWTVGWTVTLTAFAIFISPDHRACEQFISTPSSE